MSGSWYKPECKKCGYFIFDPDSGSKECSLSPTEECPYENKPNYDDDYDDEKTTDN